MTKRALLLVLTCLPAWVCAQQPKPFERSQTKQVTATIQAINQSDRHIVLLGTDGSRVLVEAGPDVKRFDQVRPGDRVVVTYTQGVIAEVKPAGEGAQGKKATTTKAQTEPGEMPAAAVGSSIATTVRIEQVDRSFNTVTFKRPDGIVRTMAVEDPDAKAFVDKLKPGDEVQITYREASAVSIEPARG